MSTQFADQTQASAFKSYGFSEAYSGPLLMLSPRDSAAFARETDRLPDSRLEGPRCVKGLVTGIGLEAAMALALFGIWHLWHLLR